MIKDLGRLEYFEFRGKPLLYFSSKAKLQYHITSRTQCVINRTQNPLNYTDMIIIPNSSELSSLGPSDLRMFLYVIQGVFQYGHLSTIGEHHIALRRCPVHEGDCLHCVVNLGGLHQRLFQPRHELVEVFH